MLVCYLVLIYTSTLGYLFSKFFFTIYFVWVGITPAKEAPNMLRRSAAALPKVTMTNCCIWKASTYNVSAYASGQKTE